MTLRHSCGVVGMYATHDVVPSLCKALSVIQHRGQESAGISVFNGNEILTAKNNGLVSTALSENATAGIKGKIGLGHVRYSTSGSKEIVNAQPMQVLTTSGVIAVAHNGEITNFTKLKNKYMETGWSFITNSDSELIAKIIAKYLVKSDDPVEAIKSTMKELEGAYSLSIMINDRLFGVRDPHGFRPLCIGKFNNAMMIVSESAAITTLAGDFVRDVEPGEIVELYAKKIVSYAPEKKSHISHCVFEWVYFARPDSIIDDREVYDVRKRIGMILAEESPVDADLVMPIPDSGRAHALGYSIASGIQYEEGFMKNRSVGRTFILPEQSAREDAVSLKMNPIKSTVNGKKVIIVDDSIVRGTTLTKLVKMLRNAGASEVHARIGCPPVIAPCYYGVDMKTRDQLVACKYDVEGIRKLIGTDSLAFISQKGIVKAMDLPENQLCCACVSNRYPTKIEGETYQYENNGKS